MVKLLKHEHVLIQARVNNPPTDIEVAKKWVKELIEKIDMELLNGPHAEYVDDVGNKGITVMALIKTSHIVMHVWDETDPALLQLDVYSCASLNVNKVREHLEQFDVVKCDWMFLDREHGFKEIELGQTGI